MVHFLNLLTSEEAMNEGVLYFLLNLVHFGLIPEPEEVRSDWESSLFHYQYHFDSQRYRVGFDANGKTYMNGLKCWRKSCFLKELKIINQEDVFSPLQYMTGKPTVEGISERVNDIYTDTDRSHPKIGREWAFTAVWAIPAALILMGALGEEIIAVF